VNDKLLFHAPETFKKKIDILSPVTGQLIALSELDDKLLNAGVFGPGAAVMTNSNTIVSPFDGTVTKVTPLDYAVELQSTAGLKCRIKYGNNTHHLHSAQFQCSLHQGDKISTKQALFTVNASWLKQQNVNNHCIMTVLNATALLGVLPTVRKYVEAGEDPLFSLYI
tara:strand:+ start:2063 stop:2563 length:501 start_codon:yes stop_codon:yes gene_type:complete